MLRERRGGARRVDATAEEAPDAFIDRAFWFRPRRGAERAPPKGAALQRAGATRGRVRRAVRPPFSVVGRGAPF